MIPALRLAAALLAAVLLAGCTTIPSPSSAPAPSSVGPLVLAFPAAAARTYAARWVMQAPAARYWKVGRGTSMLPLGRPGDLYLYERWTPGQPFPNGAIGEYVRLGGKLGPVDITHRKIRERGAMIIFQGDNCPQPDAPVLRVHVLGIARILIRVTP